MEEESPSLEGKQETGCKICGKVGGHEQDCPVLEYEQKIKHYKKSEGITREFEEKVRSGEITFENQMEEISEKIRNDYTTRERKEKIDVTIEEMLKEVDGITKEIFNINRHISDSLSNELSLDRLDSLRANENMHQLFGQRHSLVVEWHDVQDKYWNAWDTLRDRSKQDNVAKFEEILQDYINVSHKIEEFRKMIG